MIIPAILEDNLIEIQKKLTLVNKTAEKIHLDICDGIFVETKTLTNLEELDALECNMPIQIHLMTKEPFAYIKEIKTFNIYRII